MEIDGFIVLISLRIIKPVMEIDGLLRLFCFRKFYCCVIWGKKDGKKCLFFLPHNLCNRFCYGWSVNALIIAGPLNNTGLEMLMNMFGGLGAGSLTVPNRPNGYHTHLSIFFSSLFFPRWISLFTSICFGWFCLSFQCRQKNSMPLSCHSFKKWVSLTHKRIYGP